MKFYKAFHFSRMRSKRHSSRGFTFIEMLTGLTISGIIMVGLIVSAVAIMQQYRNDWVTLDLNNYGHLMLKEISERISGAQDIQVTSFNNMTRIEITDWDNRKSYIDANETEGFFVDNRPLLSGVTLPLEGLYRKQEQRVVALEDFTCKDLTQTTIQLPYRGATAFEKSVFLVSFTLSLTTAYSGADEQTESFVFSKTVFSSSKYLKARGAPVGPPPGLPATR
ncbi:MAG: prepilin-type N-terminal cleavage/methylation domain-containing protein [Candidatus Marinimicrobia bacterium]|nr:prepilin-type N-terminal cleavage/methylation domain-containing protein [Candidatus Neomarinimicrobiota bacterium]MCF7840780.1 prepilin-type N-terminal cleavage/methylation domain-containing protein [Candidatus Neomarinimicrobiota bacterium]MCF7902145.1 prepilin-type N-terminal cleavage/methylation domain-containing protein [Candidatus Neomarinimicrobiota bacterium]